MEVYGSFGDGEPEPYASADEVVASNGFVHDAMVRVLAEPAPTR